MQPSSVSRPGHFTTTRAPGRRLFVRLFPDATGVSVDITLMRSAPSRDPEESAYARTSPGAAGASTLYHLMHLAASLTETVGVQDVTERVADQLVPVFGAAGWSS